MIYDQVQAGHPATAEPTVLTHVAGILADLNANLLISKLYEHDLGKRLQPYHVQTVVDFVTGLERKELPDAAAYTAEQPAQDDTTAQPAQP